MGWVKSRTELPSSLRDAGINTKTFRRGQNVSPTDELPTRGQSGRSRNCRNEHHGEWGARLRGIASLECARRPSLHSTREATIVFSIQYNGRTQDGIYSPESS
jgi:hypothetical protein